MKEFGLNKHSLSEVAGINYGTIKSWYNKNPNPTMAHLIKLADYFGCTIDYLVGREGEFLNPIDPEERETNQS